MCEDDFEAAFQLLKHKEVYNRLLIRKTDIKKKKSRNVERLRLLTLFCCANRQNYFKCCIFAFAIEQDKEWTNNMGVKIFKIKLSNILQRNEWMEQLVNCSVKYKVHRLLKITEKSNQSLKGKEKNKRCSWIACRDLL